MKSSDAISEGVRRKLLLFGDCHDLAVSLQFRCKRRLSKWGNFVVDSALIVHFGIDLLVTLAYQACLHHAAERAVEGSRSHLHFSLRVRLYLLHDSIAVPLLGGEREEDVKNRWS